MKGSYWRLILILIFQLHLQAALCDTEFDNVCNSVPKPQPPARQYDFIYFVQQWQLSVCNLRSCLKPARQVFSIHGLWPASYSRKTQCNCGSEFVPKKISDLVDKLNVEWPSMIHEDNTLYWKNEWESHGICSEAVLPQRAYFDAALKLKQKYSLVNILAQKDIYASGNVYSKGSITDAIKTATGHSPQIQCNLYKEIPLLTQIFLCLDYNATKIIECPPSKRCQYEDLMIPYSLFNT
ncbi:extracellular ribonuclease LE-like isoform X1 [Quercus lobata]|uniref:Uncharacterized protein n=1 Tax=Quercus lobata TaxID=97700 RepID=A0A7N2L103_QUELO|nr:extracellular ribonuclease LE-like isoform X1 [Quercus lobata]